MAYQDMQVRYRGPSETEHAWYVYEPGMLAIGDPKEMIPRNDYEIIYNLKTFEWNCSCGVSLQSLNIRVMDRSEICDHALAVFRDVSQRSGPWERDGSLMQTAWRVMNGIDKPASTEDAKAAEFNRIREQAVYRLIAEMNDRKFPKTLAQQFDEAAKKTTEFSTDPAAYQDEEPPAKPAQKPEHQEPEEPKKPKSRFSEIDL